MFDENFKEAVIMSAVVGTPFQIMKQMVLKDDKANLTQDEISGVILVYLAQKYDRERLKEALENDDIDFLKKILYENKKHLSKNAIFDFKCIPNVITINSITTLISKIGSYYVGLNLGILEEKKKKGKSKIKK